MMNFASAAQIAMPGVAQPATAGSALSTAASAGRTISSEVATFSRVGLTMRFKVTVTNYGTLGHWTSCDGLKVDFKYDTVRSGGEYGTTHVLPQNVVFGPVTLKRAVEAGYTNKVREWLTTIYTFWCDDPSEFTTDNIVVIELFDVYQKIPVANWPLVNAFPVSWTGPQLNARTNEVATETLVLEHSGFLARLP